ncbi:hypothetical protein [Actinomycetospora aeridis]|uniref:Uncharacterized protein n=1 Tax=Actinomycetospora aeridis TaxID=3129231 RepID=A0ABU8N8V3_9PSEU
MNENISERSTPRAADLLSVLDIVRNGALPDSDVAALKDRYAQLRLATDGDWPPRLSYFLNELFYVMEEHSRDPRLRANDGGLDDDGLREAMRSLAPVLGEEYERMRAAEDGRAAPPVVTTSSAHDASSGLLDSVRAFLAGDADASAFTRAVQRRTGVESLPAAVQAHAGIIHRALAAWVPEGRRRLYELDEDGLRVRIADVEPRLAEAVAELS